MQCSVDGCTKSVHAQGMCQPHYRQMRRREVGLKKPGPSRQPDKPYSKYKEKAPKSSPITHCKWGHEFTEENTYRDSTNRRICKACQRERQAVYRSQYGEGPGQGSFNATKTHCAKGHPYDEENTRFEYTKNGNLRRACRACSKENGRIQRFKKYGITEEHFEEMLSYQNNKCWICQKEFEFSPHIDHDHVTGEVRGLLCYPCNSAIGNLQEDLDRITRALEYLKKGPFQFSLTPEETTNTLPS